MQVRLVFTVHRQKAKVNLIHIGRKNKVKGWNADWIFNQNANKRQGGTLHFHYEFFLNNPEY